MTVAGSLRRGLGAGIGAGILAALFAFFFAEPTTVGRSIALEAQRSAAAASAAAASASVSADASAVGSVPSEHPDPVSRDVQRRIGAPIGFILVGAALGVTFALLYAALRRFSAGLSPWRQSAFLGAAGVGVLVVPFLRYPPNPPGVGDPDTVNDRTRLYLAALLLGIAAATGAWRLGRELAGRGWPESRRQVVTVLAVIAVVGLGYLILPTASEPIAVPAKLLWDFRIQSLATQLLLWGGSAAGFGLLTERATYATA